MRLSAIPAPSRQDFASRMLRDRAAAEVWDGGMRDAATAGSHKEQVAEEVREVQTDWGYQPPSGPGGETTLGTAAQSSGAGLPVVRPRSVRRGDATVAVNAAAAAG